MPVLHALFDSYIPAANAVRALKALGVAADDISLIANRSDTVHSDDKPAAEGAELGADLGGIAGGTAGLLAGLGLVTIPGIGPVVGAGWLIASTLGLATGGALGLATGALVGALIHEGAPHDAAHTYNEGVKAGGSLVSVRVGRARVEAAEAILVDARRLDAVYRNDPEPGARSEVVRPI